MPLPDLIEIVPLDKPVRAEVTVPGSKSITNRALILAALAEGETVLRGALWSEDTQVMVEGLRVLGFEVTVGDDPAEVCNRTITVHGLRGGIPNAGTLEKPLGLFVGNAGTAARFLSALVCLGYGIYRLHGVERMHERPQEALFDALRELGYCLDSVNNKLPVLVHGSGPKPGATCCVSITESSQFASALLLCAKVGGWHVNVVGENAEESPYVAMTSQLIETFPKRGGEFLIEPDASSGSYFWAAATQEPISDKRVVVSGGQESGFVESHACGLTVNVARWPTSGWQIDEKFLMYYFEIYSASELYEKSRGNMLEMEAESFAEAGRMIGGFSDDLSAPSDQTAPRASGPLAISRQTDLGDSIMTAIVLAPFADLPAKFTDLGRLRLQECERVLALKTELTRCGAKVIEDGDSLTVYPSKLHGAEIETYNDHRMAMCFAILGLKVAGIRIKNPACVKKTFPNFFQKLAAPPPNGLGAAILDAKTGRKLAVDELFAD